MADTTDHARSGMGNGVPEPIRNGDGAPILGPRNVPLERENPDHLAAPRTDSGTVPNLKFSFATAHNRLLPGGWAREVTTRELPIATELAGVNMRLKPGRRPRAALAQGGRVGLHARRPGSHHRRRRAGPHLHRRRRRGRPLELPGRHPHSIQGLEEGCEFLLVFDDGDFSENETFLITDWFEHTSRAVLAKNFGVPKRPSRTSRSTSSTSATSSRRGARADRRGRRAVAGGPRAQDLQPPPAGPGADRGSRRAGAHRRTRPTSRPPRRSRRRSSRSSRARMRELHWHPNADEWQYYISGQGA